MSWRTMMKTEDNISNPKSNNSNNSNIKGKDLVKANIADIADIAPKNEKVKTYQQQHDHLWQKAWNLADWIDNPGSDISWQERAAKVPELQAMSLELDQLEKLMRDKLLPLIPINHNSVEEAQINLKLPSDFLQGFSPLVQVILGKQYTLDNCPARCKQTGKCYGKAYFDAKPGKAIDCVPNQCPWNDQLEQYLERDLK